MNPVAVVVLCLVGAFTIYTVIDTLIKWSSGDSEDKNYRR